MTNKEDDNAAEEAFRRGFYDIPDESSLASMSFTELAELLANSEAGSVKYQVVERELKRHVAKDQARANLQNIIIGACIAGIFALSGALVGAYIRGLPTEPPVTTQSSEVENAP